MSGLRWLVGLMVCVGLFVMCSWLLVIDSLLSVGCL